MYALCARVWAAVIRVNAQDLEQVSDVPGHDCLDHMPKVVFQGLSYALVTPRHFHTSPHRQLHCLAVAHIEPDRAVWGKLGLTSNKLLRSTSYFAYTQES